MIREAHSAGEIIEVLAAEALQRLRAVNDFFS